MVDSNKGLINPIMHVLVTCPICENENTIFYSLKAKSLASKPNVFSIPIYQDTPKYLYVDYNDYTFSVCPECYFTSVNKKEFIYLDPITGTKNKTVLIPKILQHWKENPKEIEDLLVDNFVDENSYKEPRTDEGIISSCKLAIYRTGLEIKYRVPYSYLRRAKYYLKLFYTFRKLYKKENEDYLKTALIDFEYVFKESDFPEISYEYELLYLIAAIYLRLGDEANATSYLKVLNQTKVEVVQKGKSDPKINTTDVIKWTNRARDLWQERGETSTWEILNPWPKR